MSIRVLNETEIFSISGGHSGLEHLTCLTAMLFILELPHMLHGIVEFTNWTVGLYHRHVEEDDYVGNWLLNHFCL